MHTKVIRVDAAAPQADAIAEAAEILRRGGLVAFPTETVYGLGANALDSDAVARIFVAKGRPANNPLIVHIAQVIQAKELTETWPESAEALSARFWPGPLTLVLRRGSRVPDVVTAGGTTVALRLPAHPAALALLHAASMPLAAPSANRSSSLSPTRPEHVLRGLDGRIDLLLDAGPTTGGLESTVLDVASTPPRLLRPGLIAPAQIEAVIGPIERSLPRTVSRNQPIPSPGMLSRHYAPRAILECHEGIAAERVDKLAKQGIRVGCLTFGGDPQSRPMNVTTIEMPTDPAAYSAQLYAALHDLDQEEVERIVVSMPPEKEEWLAVRDRLRRASH
ncbi:MAG TPA: L-threonylcarbamoyladenylate synthase [Gemmataceae bacterium]